MQNSLLKLSSAFFISTLLLTGCGGGGGSSSGGSAPSTDTGTDSGSDGGSGVSNFTPKQSVYLPLISGAGWNYTVESESSTTEQVIAQKSSDISGPTEQLYKATTDNGLLTYYYTSTNTKIEFWGIKGPITQNVEGQNVRVDSFFLDQAVPLWDASMASNAVEEYTNIGATIKGGVSIIPFTVDVNMSGVLANLGTGLFTTPYGEIPSVHTALELEGTGEVSGFELTVVYTDEVYFAKGVGILYRKTTIDYGDEKIINELRLTNLVNLPEPILFARSQSDAILSSSSAVVRFAGGSSLSTTSYDALNATGASWLDLNEETSNQFTVTASGGTIPSTATSEVFYFKATNGSDEIPLNVSIGN